MGIVLDHTVIPTYDAQEAVHFYTTLLGLHNEGTAGPFFVVRVNESLTLDFIEPDPTPGRHYAFAMLADEFDAAFERIRDADIAYGDNPHQPDNMQGPGMTHGARGLGKAVYFHDPSGHLLEIKTY